MSPTFASLLFILSTTIRLTTGEAEFVALEGLRRVENVPINIVNFISVLNSSEIYEVSPPSPKVGSPTKFEDYVILPQMNSDGQIIYFPYFVRVTLLRISDVRTMSHEIEDEEVVHDDKSRQRRVGQAHAVPPEVTKPKVAIFRTDTDNSSSKGVMLSGHVIHILTITLYVFLGVGIVVFLLHNCLTWGSILIWGRGDRVDEQLQLPTRTIGQYQRNSFLISRQNLYEPL